MTIKESLSFYYNGVSSTTMGISNVNISSGLQEEPFVARREIIEQSIRGREKPYLIGIKELPLSFSVEFAFNSAWTSSSIREVANWLIQPTYKELYFSDNTDRRFLAVVIDDPTLVHTCLKTGYVKLTFRCDSPYSYSALTTSSQYDYSANVPEGTALKFDNTGDLPIKPELWITKTGVDTDDISIVNNGVAFTFAGTSLAQNETIYVDNENQYILTDLPSTYRYNAFNNNYLELLVGTNNLKIYGNCKLTLRYRLKYRQG